MSLQSFADIVLVNNYIRLFIKYYLLIIFYRKILDIWEMFISQVHYQVKQQIAQVWRI